MNHFQLDLQGHSGIVLLVVQGFFYLFFSTETDAFPMWKISKKKIIKRAFESLSKIEIFLIKKNKEGSDVPYELNNVGTDMMPRMRTS